MYVIHLGQRDSILPVFSCMGPTGLNSSSVVSSAVTITLYVVLGRRPVMTADVESPPYWRANG